MSHRASVGKSLAVRRGGKDGIDRAVARRAIPDATCRATEERRTPERSDVRDSSVKQPLDDAAEIVQLTVARSRTAGCDGSPATLSMEGKERSADNPVSVASV
jgi:hypothetical protein